MKAYSDENFTDEALRLIIECKTTPSESLESSRVEFKNFKDQKALCNSKDLAEEIVALANSEGGLVIVGIKDSSEINDQDWHSQLNGIENIDLTEIGERLRGKIKPFLELQIEEISHQDLRFVIISVPEIKDSLVSTSSGKFYKRDGRSSVPMAPEEVVKTVKNLENYDWSDDLVEGGIELLNEECLQEAKLDYSLRKGLSNGELSDLAFLESLGATQNGKLTKAGLLLFGGHRQIKKQLGLLEFRFSWKTKGGELMVNDVWSGNLWATIKRARDHFDSCNTKIELTFKNRKYVAPFFDARAFHEAFMNSLVHRDYSCEGMVAVDYDSSKMQIVNPGDFYGGITPLNITQHQPRHRNKNLASMLMSFQLVDRAGMGVKRMGRQSLAYGRRFPSFSQSNGSVTVTMHGEACRPGIFVIGQNNQEGISLIQFYILNLLYTIGSLNILEFEKKIKRYFDVDWPEICNQIDSLEHVGMCGLKSGIFVRIEPKWNSFFEVKTNLRTHSASGNYVKVYRLIRECGKVANEDVRELLGHRSSSHTSQFLRKCEFLQNFGASSSSRWGLRPQGQTKPEVD